MGSKEKRLMSNKDIYHIPIVKYRNIVKGNYALSEFIDEKLGISYDPNLKKIDNYFSFRIVNRSKFLVAKIKYCI